MEFQKPTKDMLDNDLLSKSHDSEQIRVLILNQGEHQDAILYRLKKGEILHFTIVPYYIFLCFN